MATEAEKKAAEAEAKKAAEQKAADDKQREQDEANGVKGSPEVSNTGSPVTGENDEQLIADRFVPQEVKKEDVNTSGAEDPLNRPPGVYADNENAALQEHINAAREGRKPVEEYVPFHGSPRNVLDAFSEADNG